MSDRNPAKADNSGRFQKGRSGNPKGRPRGSSNPKPSRPLLDIVVDRTLSIRRNGIETEVTVEEALQHKTLQQALAGNRSARREVMKMILKREEALAKSAPVKRFPKIDFVMEDDPENANDALVILGIARRYDEGPNDKYDRLKLEPWAVQMALGRRRGGSRLTDKDVKEIKRTTWDPETIKWPRSVLDD